MATWYYVEAGHQAGPVEETALEEMLRTGRIQPDTLVWRDGMANWQPYREVKPVSTPGALPPVTAPPVASGAPQSGEVVCAECGRIFTKDNAIQYGSLWVCAQCKPVFVQKLKEGAPLSGVAGAPGGPVDPDSLAEAIRAADYPVEIGRCLSRGWDLVKSRFGIVLGTFVLVYLCLIAASSVPFIGSLVSLVVQGPLMGGLYWFFLKLARGQDASVGDGFAGFSRGWVQLMLASIVTGLLAGLAMVPGIIAFVVAVVSSHGRSPSGALIAGCLGLLAVGLVPAVYLSVCWLFTLPLVVDKQIDFWPAMNLSRKVVHLHWWSVLALLIVVCLVAFAGLLACGIGVLVTGPLAFAALVFLYEDIFGYTGPRTG